MNKNTIRGVLGVIGGFSIHLFLGCLYLFGNIQVYITSYLHKHDSSVTLNDTMIIGPFLSGFQAIVMPVGPLLLKYVDARYIMLFGATLALGGILASTFVTNVHLFIFLYGVLYGLGIGIAYLTPLITAWEYFPKRRGLVSGIIIGGFGFGAFIFGFISFAIVNPENAKPTLEVDGGKIFKPDEVQSQRAPMMLRINAGIWAVLVLISLLLVRKKPEDEELEVKNTSEAELEKQNEKVSLLESNSETVDDGDFKLNKSEISPSQTETNPTFQNKKTLSLLQVMKTFKMWHIALMVAFSMCQGTFVSYVFKSFGEIHIADDAFITTVGTIAAVCNGLCRSFWANLQDRFSYKSVFFVLLSIQICIGFSIKFVAQYKPLFLIWVGMSYFGLGGHFSMTPTVGAKLYGRELGGKVYSVIFVGFTPSSLICLVLSRVLYSKIGYGAIFFILATMGGVAFILLIFFKEIPHKDRKQSYAKPVGQ